jgi:hypothetical protein
MGRLKRNEDIVSLNDLKTYPYVGQVIIEKGFKSERAAREWMENMTGVAGKIADNVETHLWEDNVKR